MTKIHINHIISLEKVVFYTIVIWHVKIILFMFDFWLQNVFIMGVIYTIVPKFWVGTILNVF